MDVERRIVEEFVGLVRCGECGERLVAENVSVLGHQDEYWFLAVSCDKCQTQGLVTAVVELAVVDADEDEEDPTALAEDLEEHEPVSLKDVQAMRDFLATYRGDLTSLLES